MEFIKIFFIFFTLWTNKFCYEFENLKIPKRKLKILVYSPLLAWSHMKFMGKIADTLVEAGHEVHFFKLDYDPMLGAMNETKLAQKIWRIKPKYIETAKFGLDNWDPIREPFRGEAWPLLIPVNNNLPQGMKIWGAISVEICSNSDLLAKLSREHYDVAFAEMYDHCPFAIFHRIGVRAKLATVAFPLFQMSAMAFGIPSFASYQPNMYSVPINAPYMNFWERLFNFYNAFHNWAVMSQYTVKMNAPILYAKFGSQFPSSRAIFKNISLVFVNSNQFLEFPGPTFSKMIHIGGIVKPEMGQLDQRTNSILSSASDGAVLVSFGTVADTQKMGTRMLRAMLGAFSAFPKIQFLWKFNNLEALDEDDRELFNSTSNVHIFEWLQQTAILEHPNLRAFITHCGQNSLSETVNAGVPIVAIPLFADQLYNAILAKYRGIAVYVDVRHLHREEGKEIIIDALKKVLFNPSYRQNINIIQRKFELTPFSPAENLVRWVEFAAEFPELNELNLPGDDELNWVKFYSIDVIIFSIFLLIISIYLLCKFVKFSSKLFNF